MVLEGLAEKLISPQHVRPFSRQWESVQAFFFFFVNITGSTDVSAMLSKICWDMLQQLKNHVC